MRGRRRARPLRCSILLAGCEPIAAAFRLEPARASRRGLQFASQAVNMRLERAGRHIRPIAPNVAKQRLARDRRAMGARKPRQNRRFFLRQLQARARRRPQFASLKAVGADRPRGRRRIYERDKLREAERARDDGVDARRRRFQCVRDQHDMGPAPLSARVGKRFSAAMRLIQDRCVGPCFSSRGDPAFAQRIAAERGELFDESRPQLRFGGDADGAWNGHGLAVAARFEETIPAIGGQTRRRPAQMKPICHGDHNARNLSDSHCCASRGA